MVPVVLVLLVVLLKLVAPGEDVAKIVFIIDVHSHRVDPGMTAIVLDNEEIAVKSIVMCSRIRQMRR